MKKNNYHNLSLIISAIVIGTACFICIYAAVNEDNLFYGLEPKATYNGYKIYDLIEQKGLPCAEAVEILDSDNTYDYYFNCLKSDNIYLVKNSVKIKVKDAYKRGIISIEWLYRLDIIDRVKR